MHRRRFLRSVVLSMGAAGLVGCVDRGGRSSGELDRGQHLEPCPVDTLDDHDPPSNLDRETAERFVRSYEPSYIEHVRIDVDRYGRVEGPTTTVEETRAVDDGYVIVVDSRWRTSDPSPVRSLEFERVDETDVKPVPIDHERLTENGTLRQLVEDSVDEGRGGTLYQEHPDYRRTREGIEDAAGRVDGAIIEHRDNLVRVSEIERPGVHGDRAETAAYYVAPGVVSRSTEPDPDPETGDIVEC
ncbi:hypothetical protein [Halorubrum vacuolatum]|uniref:Uncharacterized protein n=1 Tax=Halorubrum vacuolatum TaxID=63740 RepID=A0A238VE17_HALVU|nr:hypothetical protein [Halorubrum vacuolatum]SNR31779.1 hypothetical protein SAMN06264855_102224 [Halorubrum vacuolatum]